MKTIPLYICICITVSITSFFSVGCDRKKVNPIEKNRQIERAIDQIGQFESFIQHNEAEPEAAGDLGIPSLAIGEHTGRPPQLPEEGLIK